MLKTAIIGCGHGGQALAADLTRRGCHVTLYAHPDHPGSIQAITNAGGIMCEGLINEFVPLTAVTTNMQQAVSGSDYIFIVVPSFAHEAMFIELLPFLQPGQTIITLAANFASLSYLRLLEKTNKMHGIDILDMASLPYICRSDHAGTVNIITVKKKLAAASIPSAAIDKHIRALTPIFPCELLPYQDVLSLGMNITSGMTHPAITLLNAGRIGEGKDTFYFYRDGITPEVAAIIELLDMERIRIGNKLGLEMYSYLDLMAEYYGTRYESIYQFFRQSPSHNALSMCPASLKDRYITQDVAGLLVPWYCLGKLVQIESFTLKNLINLASIINKTNYLRTGTNLVRLNLHDKTVDEVRQYVHKGEVPASLPGLQPVYGMQMKPVLHTGYIS